MEEIQSHLGIIYKIDFNSLLSTCLKLNVSLFHPICAVNDFILLSQYTATLSLHIINELNFLGEIVKVLLEVPTK